MKKRIISFILILSVVIGMCAALVACNDKTTIADNTEHFDAITKKLQFNKSYDGKSFLTDGIGKATVDAFTDGDTTRFVTGGDTVIIRYYCIDTPESTGSIEKWGKAASNFVKDRLSEATEIVLESTTGEKPKKDSYGTRYLGYVWYKTADSDFKLLNLEVVENGYSENKAVNTGEFIYYDYFKEANDFAQSIKLRKYSELDDPLYSDEAIEMTIKDFLNNNEAYYNQEEDIGAKVTFTAYLKELYVSESGTHTFTAVEYDAETGKTYEIAVYCAYTSSPASKMKIGHLYKITGNVQKFNGKFQISSIVYNVILQDEVPDGSYILQKDYYLTFDSAETYCDQYSATLYTDVTVKSSKVENGVLTIVGKANKRAADGKLVEDVVTHEIIEYEFTFKVNVGENYDNTFTEGTVFSTRGCQFTSKSGEITVLNLKDIIKK